MTHACQAISTQNLISQIQQQQNTDKKLMLFLCPLPKKIQRTKNYQKRPKVPLKNPPPLSSLGRVFFLFLKPLNQQQKGYKLKDKTKDTFRVRKKFQKKYGRAVICSAILRKHIYRKFHGNLTTSLKTIKHVKELIHQLQG